MLGVQKMDFVFSDLTLSPILPMEVYYKVSADHSGRKEKAFDVLIGRYENGKLTHSIPLFLDIGSPLYLFTKLDTFRQKPHYYFFNITDIFKKSDFSEEEIEKNYKAGVTIFPSDFSRENIYVKF